MRSQFISMKSSRSAVYNGKTLKFIQDSVILISGFASGILQLESLYGFGMFLTTYSFVNLTFIVWYCKLKPSEYFENPIQDIWFNSLFREITGFIMAWTFAFTLVR